ncbi:MAG: CHASE3 domain-containing protein [Acetobacteraceae bacterium]|nr:CHASE3 domain-containing protein [Acetobacteraceae bacterium]
MSFMTQWEQFRRRGVAQTVLILMSVAFVALLTVGMASAWMTIKIREQSRWVEHTYQVLQTSSDTLNQILEAQSSQRAYLLTSDASYMRNWEATNLAVFEHVEQLASLTTDNARQQARVTRLRQAAIQRIATLHHNKWLQDHGRPQDALAGVRSGRGRAQMREVRREITAIQDEERALLGKRTKALADANAATLAVDIAGVVLIALIAIGSINVIRRYIDQLQASRTELDQLNQGLEDTVAERTEQLTRANEEIQRFAYIVSHDLRAPLVNVMGYTAELQAAGAEFAKQMDAIRENAPELVNKDAELAVREDVPEAIGFIRASTSKMDRLINAILQLSRDGRRVLRAEPLDMTGNIQAIADSLKHQTDALGAAITVEPLPALTSDRLAIDQIFGNLLDNAVKYLEPGRSGEIAVRGHAEPGWLVYEVADNGRGVAPKDHERVFELFRRAGVQNTPGEGLGLAFVRNSVRRLGGTIELDSELGRGSTFRLKFPKGFTDLSEDDA